MNPTTPSDDEPDKVRAIDDALSGSKLRPDEVAELEAVITNDPDDLSARTKLLGFYGHDRYVNEASKKRHCDHVLWITQNRPDADVAGTPFCHVNAISDADAYKQAKRLWLSHLQREPRNLKFLRHAADFVLLNEPKLAEEWFKQARQLDPTDPTWSDCLGHLYLLHRTKDAAVLALAEFEAAQQIDRSEESKSTRLVALAKSAYDAGNFEKAASYAEDVLKTTTTADPSQCGEAVHHGNLVLGRVALRNGKINAARDRLLKAGQTAGSAPLCSFGPNMSLAKELLELGERDTVLQYFALCRKFWSYRPERLDDWERQVIANRIPDFGANLFY
jgi:tetratricopeptide (TPR) repeat protein